MGDYFFLGVLNVFDLVLIGILLGSVIWGIFRGMVREVLGLMSWAVSLWLAWRYGNLMGGYLVTLLNSEQISLYVGFAAVFLISIFAFTVISKMVHTQFRVTGLTLMNRLFGAMFGVVRGLVLSALLLFLLEYSPATETKWYRQSELSPYLHPLSIVIYDAVGERFGDSEL